MGDKLLVNFGVKFQLWQRSVRLSAKMASRYVLKLYEYLDDRAFNKDAYIIIRKPKHTKEHIKKFQGAVQFHK